MNTIDLQPNCTLCNVHEKIGNPNSITTSMVIIDLISIGEFIIDDQWI